MTDPPKAKTFWERLLDGGPLPWPVTNTFMLYGVTYSYTSTRGITNIWPLLTVHTSNYSGSSKPLLWSLLTEEEVHASHT